ncbi:MAG TPA: hypothetical protein VK184_00815 [Nostocaceae cyanobacterium]|nr:hypothetical protein [Nostocaceae cyanobacterium]
MTKTTDFINFSTEHPNYFPGQYLLEDDFELQHKYFSDRLLYHHQALHVSGIIEGLEVTVIEGKKSVQIKSGSALDIQGRLIIFKEAQTFSNFQNITVGELYVQYSEAKANKQQEDVTDSYTRWLENPIFGFASATPKNGIKLAKLTISEDIITLDVNIREYSGLFLPNSQNTDLTLRSGGNANPNLAVLTGNLKINGNLEVNENIWIKGETSSFLTIGDTFFKGNREWMKRGINVVWNSDNLFIGLKDEGNNRKDSVIAWGDDSQDDLRFINVQAGGSIEGNEVIRVKANGNVGIGTNNPGDYKLNVEGNQYIKGSLTIQTGKIYVDGNQQIVFADADTTNNLKLQLWNGYGLGVNLSTLFYTANGKHSWRDTQNNERMLLTTGADGGLTVKGTGTSSFAGNLIVSANITGKNLSVAADNNQRGALFFATPGDYNHALYNNLSNIDNEGIWDGVKWNVFQGLKIRVGSGESKKTALYINNNGDVGIGVDNPGNYKLNVEGNQYIKGSLTIQIGKINLDGNQQIVFKDGDATNNLKLQLWSGYGLGINSSTLFYTANGKHSWRDSKHNERMFLTTEDNATLTVNTGGVGAWNKFVVNTTSEWGDDNSQYVTIGSGGANGIMLSNPHVTWRSNRASIRYGRSGGIKTGVFWDGGVRADGSFSFSLNGENDHKLTITKDGNVGIGTNNPGNYKLNVQGNQFVSGEVRAKIWYSDEYEWSDGKAPVRMGKSDKCVAFITYVRGKFAGGGERVFTYIGDDGYWYLSGAQGGEGKSILVKARCIGSPD